ncbi:radical SAM protein [Streptomyces anulatus]|uniref:radical SAM protein n=1 Tax=Streptomyces anulatus TaxID=1892 RepID=UPI003685EF18
MCAFLGIRYEELRAASHVGGSLPAWLVDAARQAWGTELPDGPVCDFVLVRERSPYGYAKASWEINLGCDYDCEFCCLGEKRFEGLDWAGKQQLLRTMRDAGVLWLQITGGEALIDRKFGAAYEYAHQLGMMVQVSSNGSSLRKSPIRGLFARRRPYRLTLSVYGATAGTYDKVTRNRGAFGRFIQGLDAAHQDRLPVRLNVIVSDDNAHEVDAMVALCDRYSFRPRRQQRLDQSPQLIVHDPRSSTHTLTNGRIITPVTAYQDDPARSCYELYRSDHRGALD